jgi:hypothetical protein
MGDKHSAPGAVFTVPNSPTRFGINVLYRGHLYRYFGNFSSSVPNFATSNATVKFDSAEDTRRYLDDWVLKEFRWYCQMARLWKAYSINRSVLQRLSVVQVTGARYRVPATLLDKYCGFTRTYLAPRIQLRYPYRHEVNLVQTLYINARKQSTCDYFSQIIGR